MKITKKQLKRIILEEKLKLVKEQGRPRGRGGDYSTGRWDGLEEKFDTVLYELQQMGYNVRLVSKNAQIDEPNTPLTKDLL